MNNHDIDQFFESIGMAQLVQKLEQPPSAQWLFQAVGFPMFIQTQESANRMRIVAFINEINELCGTDFIRLLEANYHSALDARYAVSDGRLVSVFLHPLRELSREQLVDALSQVTNCAETHESTCSGGNLHFGAPAGTPAGRATASDPESAVGSKIADTRPSHEVFVSYAHADRSWLEKLMIVMKPLIRNKSISVWYDAKVKPSQKWRQEIDQAMEAAKVVLFLVSPHSLASSFIDDHELAHFLIRAKEQRVKIGWVAIAHSLVTETPIIEYQALHDIAKPLNSLQGAEQDQVLVDICLRLRSLTRQGQ